MPAVIYGLKPYTAIEEAFAQACRLGVRREVDLGMDTMLHYPHLNGIRPDAHVQPAPKAHQDAVMIGERRYVTLRHFVIKNKVPTSVGNLHQWLVNKRHLICATRHPTHKGWRLYQEDLLLEVYKNNYFPKRKPRL